MTIKPSGSLGTKIIVWFFVPTAIILIAVALVTFFAYQQVTEELVIERDQELTRLAARQLSGDLETYTNLLFTVARTSYLEEGEPDAGQDALTSSANRLSAFNEGLFILDNLGVVVAAEPYDPSRIGVDISNTEIYRDLVRRRMFGESGGVFSNLVKLSPIDVNVIIIAVPIISPRDEFKGALIGMIRVGEENSSFFRPYIEALGFAEQSTPYLLDQDGHTIYHPDPSIIGDVVQDPDIISAATRTEVSSKRTKDALGEDIIVSLSHVPGTPWNLVVEENWNELTQASRGYQSFLILLLMLGVIIPAIVVAFGVQRVMRPIQDLISASKEVAEGRFGQNIEAQTGDEIEELASQFNLMSTQLAQSYANLEQRVEARTKELDALYTIASVLSQTLDLEEILEIALNKTLEVMGIEAGGITLVDEKSGELDVATYSGLSEGFISSINKLPTDDRVSSQVVQTGEPLVITEFEEDESLSRLLAMEEGIQSAAVIPLVSRAVVLGSMFVTSRSPRAFTEQEIDLLTSIGQQIGGAVENARLFAAVERQVEQFRVISEVGEQVTSLMNVNDLLQQMVKLIKDAFDYYQVEIALLDHDELVFLAGEGGTWTHQFDSFRLKVPGEGVSGWVAAHNEPVIIRDVREDKRYVRVSDTQTLSELVVPIEIKENVIGVLNIESDQVDFFDKSDLTVMQSLADQLAVAIDNARLLESEIRRAEQFRVISEVGRQITSILDIDELLDEIVRVLQESFGYYLITVGLIEGDELVFKAGTNPHSDEPQFTPPSVKVGEKGITGWVAGAGEPILANDVREHPQFLFLLEAQETQSELAVPMKTKSGVIGVLNVESDQKNAFDESDLIVLQLLALQASIAIENARLYEQAGELAAMEERSRLARDLHDSVTQTLFSSSLIAEVLPRLWEKNTAEGERRLLELRQLSRGALAEMRTLLMELRPTAMIDADMEDLLHQLAEVTTTRSGIPVIVEVEGEHTLPDRVKIALYYISQEAMNNVSKHAHATSVHVHFQSDPHGVKLQVADDGSGFDLNEVTPEHLGLGIMGERADAIGAQFSIKSTVGEGTEITVTWENPDHEN
jgi:nitrate/nitrite-specific signal transduction histidine kinase